MKIIKKLFLSFVIAGLGFATLVGCVSLENAERISIVEMPTTTFVKNQEVTGNLMKVLITDAEGNDVVLTLSYPDENGNVSAQQDGVPFDVKITIKNFNLSTIGNKTASVTYGEATSYFDYQVVDPEQGFAGGNGSLNNPYQITNAIQFMNINTLETTKDVYFKLMNDIDMSTVINNAQMFWDMGYAFIQLFEGVLDGNNKRIYNVVEPINYLFGELSGATLKDLSVFVKGKDISVSCLANSYGGRTISFLNVDLYGSVSTGYNYAGYAIYSMTLKYAAEGREYSFLDSTVVFKNCDSYLDNIGLSTRVGVFFAIPTGNYTFENCYNYGHVEALNTSLLFTNGYATGYGASGKTVYKVISSGNRGTLSSVEAKSNLVFCNKANGGSHSKLEGSEELVEGTNLVIPTLDFTQVLQVQDNYLELKAVADDSNIAKVKVNLYFEGMSCKEYGTLTDFVTVELSVSSEAQKTGLFATEIKDGKLSIKVVTKGSIEDTTEASDEIVTLGKDWLTYNVTKGFYVFDGTKVKEGYTFTVGSQSFSVFAYNSEEEVIASVKVATK
ncbi:MAG TPA: hypothetical protein DCR62_06575 [Acholeplasmatales bacterium]|nr:hypothetical protein [Acholeplasmatales bacterium]